MSVAESTNPLRRRPVAVAIEEFHTLRTYLLECLEQYCSQIFDKFPPNNLFFEIPQALSGTSGRRV
jgi:hypothetical protein